MCLITYQFIVPGHSTIEVLYAKLDRPSSTTAQTGFSWAKKLLLLLVMSNTIMLL